ncbi:hypothetical protein MFRU_004g02340 [Monilinia fructicola]|nr:hypothetical protein MFRU_004g02340 [Monilinia fructicola]
MNGVLQTPDHDCMVALRLLDEAQHHATMSGETKAASLLSSILVTDARTCECSHAQVPRRSFPRSGNRTGGPQVGESINRPAKQCTLDQQQRPAIQRRTSRAKQQTQTLRRMKASIQHSPSHPISNYHACTLTLRQYPHRHDTFVPLSPDQNRECSSRGRC